jgi:hyperosmotically inducible protein
MSSYKNVRMMASDSLIALWLASALCCAAPALADSAEPDPVAHSDSIGAALHDTGITAKVEARFAGERNLHSSDIKVTTTNGVVTLTGTADSASRKSAARIAEGVEGVKSVDNELRSSKHPPAPERAATAARKAVTDSWITTKVKSTILADSVSRGFEVSVETRHGVVVLRGQLANKDSVDHVRDLARNIEGVKSVDVSGLATTG